MAICTCLALKACQAWCGCPGGFVPSMLWVALPTSSSAPPAHSALHGCSGGTCHLTPCSVFLGKIFFQLARSEQLMVSCSPLDLHLGFLYATTELPLLGLLWASTRWVSPQQASRYIQRNGGAKRADLLQQISTKEGSVEEGLLNAVVLTVHCAVVLKWHFIFKSLYCIIPAMWRCTTNLPAQAQYLFTHPFPRWW